MAAIRASQLGAKVVLIEKDRIGGTCLNRGCIPTKSLLWDAKLLRSIKRSTVFQPLSSDGRDLIGPMMERKQKVVQDLLKGIEMVLASHRVVIKSGSGDLLGLHEVVVKEAEQREIIKADSIILAMGSKPKALAGITPDGEGIITSDEALEIRNVPKDLVIIGGGYIGVEFATFFHALGSHVTIVEVLESILPGLEGEMVRYLRRLMEGDGIRILTGSGVEEIIRDAGALRLVVRTSAGLEEIPAEKVLLSVGRVPNPEVDLSKAGVETLPSGIRVNRRMETTAPSVYAVGDVTGGMMLAHVASEEGTVAAENIMGADREMESDAIPFCVFSNPEIASVGMTEKEARARGPMKIGRFPFRSNPAAAISGETEGLIKVIADQGEDRIVGVHIIGHDAGTLISIASSLMKQGIKASEFSKSVQAHPTSPEALKEAFLDVAGLAIHLPKPLRAQKH